MSHNTYHQGNDSIYPLPIHNFFDKMELCKDLLLSGKTQKAIKILPEAQ